MNTKERSDQAIKLTNTGKLLEAEKIYLEILAEEKNHPNALYGLSLLADKINDQVVREDLLRRAIDELADNKEPRLVVWLAELAECLIKQKKIPAAQEVAQKSKAIMDSL